MHSPKQKNCQICEKEIPEGSKRFKFCSLECQKIGEKQWRDEHALHSIATCPICGVEFERMKHGPRIYCSEECRLKHERSEQYAKRKQEKPLTLSAEQVLPDPVTKERSNEVWKHHLEIALDEEARRALNVSSRQWEYYKTVHKNDVDDWKDKNRKSFYKAHKRKYITEEIYL